MNWTTSKLRNSTIFPNQFGLVRNVYELVIYLWDEGIGIQSSTSSLETIYKLSNIDDLVVSIDEVGLLQPLVVNQQYQVISGHRRLEAVRQLGWSEVDVEVIETSTEDETKSLLVHYNKQRVKTCREILNETQVLRPLYRVGQGKRTDLTTSVRANRSTGRDVLAESVGIPSSRLAS